MNTPDVVACSAEAAFSTGGKGIITAWNKAAEELFGYEASEVLGQLCHPVLCGTDVFGNRFCDANCLLSSMTRRRQPVHDFQIDVREDRSEVFRANVSVIVLPGETPTKFSIIHVLKPLEGGGEAASPHSRTHDPKDSNPILGG